MAEAPEEYHPRVTEENVEGVEVLENAPHRCLETFGNLSKLLRSHLISSNSKNARNIHSDIGSISNRSNIDNSGNSNINGILGMSPFCSSNLYLYM